MASKTIAADDSYQHILVVGAYGMTRYVNWKDKKTCTLFADGAGAVVLRRVRPAGLSGREADGGRRVPRRAGHLHRRHCAARDAGDLAASWRPPAVQFVRKFPATFNTERWPRPAGQDARARGADPGRREALRLHPAQPAHHRSHHGGAQAAHVQDALDDGQVGLHGQRLHPHDAGRRGGAGPGEARGPGGPLRERRRAGLALASTLFRWTAPDASRRTRMFDRRLDGPRAPRTGPTAPQWWTWHKGDAGGFTYRR